MRMRKLILAATLLGGSMLPLAPPAAAQRTVVVTRHRPVRVRRGRFFHRGRWYHHRRFRRGHWVYW
jgi:hypothetical protein